MKVLNKIYVYMILGLMSVSVSCTDGFEDLNKNPLNPPYVPSQKPDEPGEEPEGEYADIDLSVKISTEELDALKEGVNGIGAIFKSFTYEGLVDDYQRATNLTHDIYAGYFASNNPGFVNGSPNYIYTEDWSGRRWNHFYKKRSTEYKMLARTFSYVDREKYKNAFYITRIYYAFLASTMTDTYGDMPFVGLVKAEELSQEAKYDTQKTIYDKIFRMLTQAADSIKPGASSFKFESTDDKCYAGDEDKWVRFANTLRLRLALRISNVDPERAKKEGEAALAHPGGIMRNQNDRMRTVPNHAPVSMGGENSGGQENEVANCSFRYVDVVMSKDMEVANKSLSEDYDPRMEICWFRPTDMSSLLLGYENHRNDFNGCEIGNNNVYRASDEYSVLRVNAWESKENLRNDYWFGYSREFIWFGYAESRFLLAEAALRGWSGVNGSVEELFKDGIRESMNYYFIANRFADSYINGLKIYNGQATNPFVTGDKEGMLEQIITQKWLAIFPNGNEGWAEFRRTDYPRLRNHLDNRDANIPVGKFIKRIQYPFSEYDYNPKNVPSMSAVNQATRLWWDVADTNNSSGVRNKPNNFR